MRQIVPLQWKKKIRHFMLDLDARIDSTLFSSGKGARELYERLGFHVEGVRRDYYQEPREDALILWNRSLARSEPLC